MPWQCSGTGPSSRPAMPHEACNTSLADGALGAASSSVRPSASFRRRRRARVVAVRHAQRQACEILRMVETPHLLAPPGLHVTNFGGDDNETGPFVKITTSTPFVGSGLDIGTSLSNVKNETVPQINVSGVDSKHEMVPDVKTATSPPTSDLDSGTNFSTTFSDHCALNREACFLDHSDLAMMRAVSRSYCDLATGMIGKNRDEGKHDLGNRSTADNVTVPDGKRPPSKMDDKASDDLPSEGQPSAGSGGPGKVMEPKAKTKSSKMLAVKKTSRPRRVPRRRPVPRQQRFVDLEASPGLQPVRNVLPSARLLHYEEWCDGCFEVVEVPIAIECSHCEDEAREIGVCEHCRAVVCFSCIDAAGAVEEFV